MAWQIDVAEIALIFRFVRACVVFLELNAISKRRAYSTTYIVCNRIEIKTLLNVTNGVHFLLTSSSSFSWPFKKNTTDLNTNRKLAISSRFCPHKKGTALKHVIKLPLFTHEIHICIYIFWTRMLIIWLLLARLWNSSWCDLKTKTSCSSSSFTKLLRMLYWAWMLECIKR